MRLDEMKALLAESGLPVAYNHWSKGKAPALPYILFAKEDSETNGSDYGCELRNDYYLVELYSKENCDLEAKSKLENVLDKAGIHYETDEDYIQDENIYVLEYRFELYYRRVKNGNNREKRIRKNSVR